MRSLLIAALGWRLTNCSAGPSRSCAKGTSDESLPATVEKYFDACEAQTRAEHFALSPTAESMIEEAPGVLTWRSPSVSLREFPLNERARATLYRTRPEAPTIIILHALMSASDAGYVRWARHFNSLGWNAALVQLPFHYSRRPSGHLNGELCCTADLILTGDTLRQAVVEIRQLMAWLRGEGVREFGLLSTSYGGWVAALLASLEPDLRFLALLAPMVNIGHALYEGPTSWTIRRHLLRAGIERKPLERHAHLSSPFRSLRPLRGLAGLRISHHAAGPFWLRHDPARGAMVRHARPSADRPDLIPRGFPFRGRTLSSRSQSNLNRKILWAS